MKRIYWDIYYSVPWLGIVAISALVQFPENMYTNLSSQTLILKSNKIASYDGTAIKSGKDVFFYLAENGTQYKQTLEKEIPLLEIFPAQEKYYDEGIVRQIP